MIDEILTDSFGIRVFTILVGIAVLTLGRRLFWLATAVAGFIFGLTLVAQSAGDQPDWLILVIAIIAGVIGAVLAVFIQRLAVAIVGLILGGYGMVSLFDIFGLGLGEWAWLLFIIGAIVGVVLALSLLEPALIVLSALAGAILIVQSTNFSPLITGILFVVLIAVGISIQARMLPKDLQ